MTITIEIETDNAAFTQDRAAEVCRIITEYFELRGLDEGRLRDYNGNTVGHVTIDDPDDREQYADIEDDQHDAEDER